MGGGKRRAPLRQAQASGRGAEAAGMVTGGREGHTRWRRRGEMLLYVNGVYYIFYFLATLMMIVYKSQVFSYPDDFLAPDLVVLFVMAILEVPRLYLGSKGNLTEEEAPLGLSLVLTLGSVVLAVYFLAWQTYVLRADVILNALLLSTYGLESGLKVMAIAAFVS
ncbi:transmembrane protein 80 isoform X1 [Pogoniulus pusillus]|uniref:transmembrane protein 80 isoform X1 n=2 Tax=Pogoniulus pusillus TaxID=488313 RepID=UPI0030B99BD4